MENARAKPVHHLTHLTGLRAVAALYVMIFHIEQRFEINFLPQNIIAVIQQGALGVNLFFFLSGFILTYSYQYKLQQGLTTKAYISFMAKRLARLYPTYCVGLILCVLLSMYLPGFQETSPKLIALNLAMAQSYFPEAAMRWYGSGSWSISDEFFFYATFPFVMLLLLRIKSKKVLLLLAALFCITASIPGLLYNFNETLLDPRFIYTFPPLRLSEFLCGIVAALLVFNHHLIIKPKVALAAITVTILYLVFGPKFSWIVAHNLVALPAIFIIISSIVVNGRAKLFDWLGSKIMVYLGKISYSIYIIQLPIALTFNVLLDRKIVAKTDSVYILVWIAVNILGAALLYHFIEHPVYTKLHALIDRKKKTVLAVP